LCPSSEHRTPGGSAKYIPQGSGTFKVILAVGLMMLLVGVAQGI
jgi:hypothetical protein